MKHADDAMYKAKEAGRDCFRLFDAAAKPPTGEGAVTDRTGQ